MSDRIYIELERGKAEEFAEAVARAVCEPRRFHENQDAIQQQLGQGVAMLRNAIRAALASEESPEERSACQCSHCPRDYQAEGFETLPIDWTCEVIDDHTVLTCPHCSPESVEGEDWPEEIWRIQIDGMLNPDAFHTRIKYIAEGWEQTGAKIRRYIPVPKESEG